MTNALGAHLGDRARDLECEHRPRTSTESGSCTICQASVSQATPINAQTVSSPGSRHPDDSTLPTDSGILSHPTARIDSELSRPISEASPPSQSHYRSSAPSITTSEQFIPPYPELDEISFLAFPDDTDEPDINKIVTPGERKEMFIPPLPDIPTFEDLYPTLTWKPRPPTERLSFERQR